MNIFHTNECPFISASSLCDIHVNKMLTETVQMLCTAIQLNTKWVGCTHDPNIWRSAYPNHPMTRWVRESLGNYQWAFAHAHGLKEEYWFRFGKRNHKSVSMLQSLPPFYSFDLQDMTEPPQCMPDEYKQQNYKTAYKNYYIGEKLTQKWCVWNKGRQMPDWLKKHP